MEHTSNLTKLSSVQVTGTLLEDESVSNEDLDLEEAVQDDGEVQCYKYYSFGAYGKKICLIGPGGLFTADA